MIRSIIDYSRFFATSLFNGPARSVLNQHRTPFVALETSDRRTALEQAVGYLLRAQRQGPDDGLASYHLVNGWGSSYPETTGYAIPSLIKAAEYLGRPEAVEAALRAAEWLLTIQRPDGGWQGGRIGEDRPSIVFNTAQVVRGLLAAHQLTGEVRLLEAAARAGQWIAKVQEADGTWRKHNFLGSARVYDTYVDAPLLLLHGVTGDPVLRYAAERNLEWVIGQRLPNGWFNNCDNTLRHNDRPITHTIAYTLDGLLECGSLLGDQGLIDAASPAAAHLRDVFLRTGHLHGRYAADWRGSEHPILTGCVQLAIVWSALHLRTGDDAYRVGLIRMADRAAGVQRMSLKGPAPMHGALPGSYPVWGRYEKFAFPNWATKYFIDALLCAERSAPSR